mmetsp:Transcript_6121/g.10391  ORF Transcript_6121/g.10391 Transcript_6121/m.10391 type:complete len:401 (+) Transcript_6121:548-1750(+)
MIARSFLKLCRYNHLIPHLFNIESLEVFMEQTLPPITNGEYEFYEKQKLSEAYNDDKNFQTTMVEPMVNQKDEAMEPELHFHEFLFLLGLIAKNQINSSKDDSIQSKLQEFFVQKLNFKKVSQLKDVTLNYEDVLNKVFNVEAGSEKYDKMEGDYGDEDEWGESGESEDEFGGMSNQKVVMDLIQKQNQMESEIFINWDNILSFFENELPKIPAKPVVEQINPPPYSMPRVLFGKLMPKPEDDDKKKKKGAKKAAQKKDGPPPKPIKWADGPPKYVKNTLHYMQEARKDIVENFFPLNLRGDQGNPGVAPCLIKEVYFPPEAPTEVATLIESALVYQNSSNYEMAVRCFQQAKQEWIEFLKDKDIKTLKKEQEMFFELSIGSVYESCGKDDLALNFYMKS